MKTFEVIPASGAAPILIENKFEDMNIAEVEETKKAEKKGITLPDIFESSVKRFAAISEIDKSLVKIGDTVK